MKISKLFLKFEKTNPPISKLTVSCYIMELCLSAGFPFCSEKTEYRSKEKSLMHTLTQLIAEKNCFHQFEFT